MATVPIVTEVTKAQLDALVAASGLNEGLQYKVTDKGWDLVASSASTLRSVKVFVLNYSDTMPNYISVEAIWVDTGFITLPQSELYPFPIISGYFPIGQFYIDTDGIPDLLVSGPADIILPNVSGKQLINLPLLYISTDPMGFYTDLDLSTNNQSRFLIKYEKDYTAI